MMKTLLMMMLCLALHQSHAQNWKVITPFNNVNVIRDMEVTPNGTLYVVASGPARMFKSVDGGLSWSAMNIPTVVDANPADLFMLNDNKGYMITRSGSLFRTTDGWKTSTTLSYPSYPLPHNRVFFVNENVGFIVGYRRFMNKTLDGGNTWTSISIPSTLMVSGEDVTDVHFVNENIGFAISAYGNVFKTTDQGATWTKIQLQQNGYALEELFFINETTGFAAGPLGEVYRTADQGATWTLTDTAMGIIHDMRLHNGVLYMVGTGTTFSTSTDNGLTWSPVQNIGAADYYISSFTRMYAVTFLNGTILAAGEGGVIFRKNISGTSPWSVFYYPIWGDVLTTDLKFANENQGLLVGSGNSQSVVYYTENGGYKWQRKLLGTSRAYRSVNLKPNGKGLLTGQVGYTTTADYGQTWASANMIQPSTSYTRCWLKSNNEFFVGTNPGSPPTDGMIRRTASGAWARFDDMDQIGEIKFADEQIGYAGVSSPNYTAHLWKTNNGGATWSILESYQGGLIDEIQIINQNKLYVRDLYNVSQVSEDGGATWTSLTSVEFPDRYHFFDEQNAYGIDGYTRHVYKTEDGGASWQILVNNDNSLCGIDNLAWFADRIVYAGEAFKVCILDIPAALRVNPALPVAANNVMVYPNPASDVIKISEMVQSATITDSTGKNLGSYGAVNSLDISGLEQGVYFVTLVTTGGQKIVKQVVKK